MSRQGSLIRRALAAGADGKHKEIAVDVFPLNDCYTGTKKLGRMLDAGDNGDLSPNYDAMDRIITGDPETVLGVLSAELGFEPPRRSVVDVSASIARLEKVLDWVALEVRRLGKQQRQPVMVRRASASDVQGKARA